jgi:hypothetical protein
MKCRFCGKENGKKCSKCGRFKDLGDFFKDKRNVGGLRGVCKECISGKEVSPLTVARETYEKERQYPYIKTPEEAVKVAEKVGVKPKEVKATKSDYLLRMGSDFLNHKYGGKK